MVTCNNAYFQLSISFLFNIEGGYSNHKNDRGGATNYGITQKTYDNYRKKYNLASLSVKQIKKEEAEKIYYEEYWLPSGTEL